MFYGSAPPKGSDVLLFFKDKNPFKLFANPKSGKEAERINPYEILKVVAFSVLSILLCFILLVPSGNLTSKQDADGVYSMYLDNTFMGFASSPKRGLTLLDTAALNARMLVGEECESNPDIRFSINGARMSADENMLSQNLLAAQIRDYEIGTGIFIDGALISVNHSEDIVNQFALSLAEKVEKNARLSVPGKLENIEILTNIDIKTKYYKKSAFETNEQLFAKESELVGKSVMLKSSQSIGKSTRLSGNYSELISSQSDSSIKYSATFSDEITVAIPHKVVYTLDDSKPAGVIEVVCEGEDGILLQITHTYVENGMQIEAAPMDSVVTKEPVDGIVSIGTAIQINSPSPSQDTGFGWPFDGEISSGYGLREDGYHDALDIRGPEGSVIVAAKDGTVVFSGNGNGNGYGNYVIIKHNDEESTLYAHNISNSVSVGDYVVKGQEIARIGMTGRASGNHVHFEIRINDVRMNPLDYLPKR